MTLKSTLPSLLRQILCWNLVTSLMFSCSFYLQRLFFDKVNIENIKRLYRVLFLFIRSDYDHRS